MPWIAVHDEVLGGKLRGLRKKLKCSEAEALGILTYLWLWARKNTDITGLLENTDKDDIASVIKPILSNHLNAETVVNALISCEWLDEKDGSLYVHDWQEWQSYWYTYLDKREKDKVRKRLEREREKSSKKETANESPKPSESEPSHEDKAKKAKSKKTPKTKYAESVSMYPSEMEKLVALYGDEFTKKLIEELNNYKLANGKSYKDDYRAILTWVVEKCEKKYPGLKKTIAVKWDGGNPFEAYK